MMVVKTQASQALDTLLLGIADAPAVPVSGFAIDHRDVTQGFAFCALQGHTRHGIEFANDARANGAVALLTDLPADDARLANVRLPVVCLPNARHAIGRIAARFYANPTRQMQVIAVTGTNGKSSISWLIAGAFSQLNVQAGLSGTLGSGTQSALQPQSLTTTDAISLQREARRLADEQVEKWTLEASSHAIDQQRLAGADIDVAVFSNLTRDHLDYHRDMEAYFEAKAALFDVETLSARIVCVDDRYGARLAARHHARVWQVSTTPMAANGRPDCFVFADSVSARADGLQFDVVSHCGRARIDAPLVGHFNVQNLLLAMAVLLQQGIAIDDAAAALSQVTAPPGRMQRIGRQQPAVYVDFAHTPDALSKSLETLNEHCIGDIWCVFGSGGDRDRGKRAPMAAAAEGGADHLILTSDNPRSESPLAIIDDMREGLVDATPVIEVDRARAIEFAIANARADDCVLIAGKGHETTQTIGERRLPFDDAVTARLALNRAGKGEST